MEKEVKHDRKQEIGKEVLYLLRTVVITFVCVFMVMKFFFRPIQVSGDSMYPALENGNFGFSNVLGSLINEYERFDVVVVDPGEKALDKTNKNTLWVKRIIALPGETLEYKNDQLYINGKYVKESYFDKEYVKKKTYDGDLNFTDDFGPITLKNDEYFLMGDNRDASYDSRMAGPFKESQIVSKSMLVLFPLDSIGMVR